MLSLPSNIFIRMTGIDRSAILSKIPAFLILKQGKDVCDCIISPMKGAICRYCYEGHNILTTADMHNALEVREVKESPAAVCKIVSDRNDVKIKSINNFSFLSILPFKGCSLSLKSLWGWECQFSTILRACP